jgi:hypothetical protein
MFYSNSAFGSSIKRQTKYLPTLDGRRVMHSIRNGRHSEQCAIEAAFYFDGSFCSLGLLSQGDLQATFLDKYKHAVLAVIRD